MLNKVKIFIEEQKLFSKNDTLFLAISGGVDSVVLAHLLTHLGYKITLLHCNFQLRGEESLKDEKFVRHLAVDLDSEIQIKRIDIGTSSIQLEARKKRYAWFKEVVLKSKGILITAHHKSDILETMILNLGRGTGLEGLHGILPKNNENTVRPLLCVSKEEILDYAAKNNIVYREDESNKSTNYVRNKIRHNVVPALKKIFPEIEDRAWETSKRIKESEDVLFKSKDSFIIQEFESNHFKISGIKKNELGVSTLYFHCKQYGFNKDNIVNLVNSTTSGKKVRSSNWELYKDRTSYYLKKIDESIQESTIKIKVKNQTIETPIGNLKIEMDANLPDPKKITKQQCFLDATLLHYPLELRKWKEGDKFKPLGMKGFKKISDFLIDEKIPLTIKDSIWVLCSQKEIVWVLNHRLDERYKVTPETEEVLKLELL